ncbi:MAG: PilZ domain-containing protein [Thioalkalispiraceae bacterium]|jgi:hypothetical protein
MERRLNPRIPATTKVTLYYNGSGRIKAHLNDFSQGGVAITLDEHSHAPEINDVIFMLASNMDEPYLMKVVRCEQQNWMLSFMD